MARIKAGESRWFSPYAAGDEEANLAAGRVEVLGLVSEGVQVGFNVLSKNIQPMYRVKNLDNGYEAMAFGDELSTT